MHLVVEVTVDAGLCQGKDGEQREQVITFRSLVFLGGQSPAEPAWITLYDEANALPKAR